MNKLILILVFLISLEAIAQNQKHLKYIRFLDIGVTPDAHKANTLTVSIDEIDRKIKLERNNFGLPVSRPLGFDMDSLYQRYSVTDKRTYNKILKFLESQKQIKHTISELHVEHLEYPTFKIIVDGKRFFYIKHEDVDNFFNSLILYLKTNTCDPSIIKAVKISKFG